MGCQREAPVYPFNRVGNGLTASHACVWRAIISSSLVGITHAETRLEAVLMRGPCVVFAAGSRLTPSPGSPPAHRFAHHHCASCSLFRCAQCCLEFGFIFVR